MSDAALTLNDVGRLDEDKLMAHILDCVAALAEKQRVRVALKQPVKLSPDSEACTPEQQVLLNQVFKAALALLAGGLTHDGAADDERSTATLYLSKAFPDASKLTDGRGWLPLHWAVLAASVEHSGVTLEDVKAMYELGPLALCRHHLTGYASYPSDDEGCTVGFTPAHLLCMLETTERTEALVRFFSESQPQSFTMNVSYDDNEHERVFGALHVACRFGQPKVWLLQQLLQLDSSACQKSEFYDDQWRTPLGLLFEHSAHVDDGTLRCLLAADSSAEVVYDGVRGCFYSKLLTNRVALVTLLLEANPQAAQYYDELFGNLANLACSNSDHMTAQECIDIVKLLLAVHKDAFKEGDFNECLPLHRLAQYGPVEALEYLLGACPEVPATALTGSSRNLLHCVDTECDTEAQGYVESAGPDGATTGTAIRGVRVMAAKARLLCSRYPAMVMERNEDGQTPLHSAYGWAWYGQRLSSRAEVVLALCEAGGREAASAAVVNPRQTNYRFNGWLPLHAFVKWEADHLKKTSLTSPEADAFRLLLRLYPEAAGVEAGNGEDRKTPYQLAVDSDLPAYYRRLLLRAAPALDPAELRRLNWEERRMAMFVAFKATFPKGPKPPLLARFRLENSDVVKHVVSFL